MIPRKYPGFYLTLYRFSDKVILKLYKGYLHEKVKFLVFDEKFTRQIKNIKNIKEVNLNNYLTKIEINDINYSYDYHFNMRRYWIINIIKNSGYLDRNNLNPKVVYCLCDNGKSIAFWRIGSYYLTIIEPSGISYIDAPFYPDNYRSNTQYYGSRRYDLFHSYDTIYDYYRLFQFSGKLVTFQAHQDISFKYL